MARPVRKRWTDSWQTHSVVGDDAAQSTARSNHSSSTVKASNAKPAPSPQPAPTPQPAPSTTPVQSPQRGLLRSRWAEGSKFVKPAHENAGPSTDYRRGMGSAESSKPKNFSHSRPLADLSPNKAPIGSPLREEAQPSIGIRHREEIKFVQSTQDLSTVADACSQTSRQVPDRHVRHNTLRGDPTQYTSQPQMKAKPDPSESASPQPAQFKVTSRPAASQDAAPRPAVSQDAAPRPNTLKAADPRPNTLKAAAPQSNSSQFTASPSSKAKRPAEQGHISHKSQDATELVSEGANALPLTSSALIKATGTCPVEHVDSSEETPCVVSETGIGEDKASHSPDIRGKVPPQIYTEQDWEVTRRPRDRNRRQWDTDSPPSDFRPSSILTDYVEFWANRVNVTARPRFLEDDVEGHVHCDVDTETGELLRPCAYAESTHRLYPAPKKTSETAIKSRMQKVNRRRAAQEAKEEGAKAKREILELERYKAEKTNRFLCRTPIHVRPAIEGDMEEVATLYNQEIKDGWRAMDQEPVSPTQWREKFRLCRKENLPFNVVLDGYLNPYAPEEGHKVVGFAYIDVASRGVAGGRSIAEQSARLFFLVDPAFRRKRVGTALLDSIMALVSVTYNVKEESYQWVNDTDNAAYLGPAQNPRQWRTLVLDVYVKNQEEREITKKGDEYQFIWNWLETEFNFGLVSHSPRFGLTENSGNTISLDRLSFEHPCRLH